ncbi:flagellar basal body P-ring formation chaperone FlgA [Burkholderia gladioli]|uniref:flagellar basal body P-ring formation chaperone FlgA n=1 Tax=Burkholderia gladioli TaxID=28095 RepID=UPI0021B37422|nr:flagellar basal body P-ring formation chaperone FlgA [Burkholderia gladioli]
MATDAGPVSGSGKAARALGRRALLALALAALLPAAALAQSAGADGMIVIPGRGESAETALANANAHGVNTPPRVARPVSTATAPPSCAAPTAAAAPSRTAPPRPTTSCWPAARRHRAAARHGGRREPESESGRHGRHAGRRGPVGRRGRDARGRLGRSRREPARAAAVSEPSREPRRPARQQPRSSRRRATVPGRGDLCRRLRRRLRGRHRRRPPRRAGARRPAAAAPAAYRSAVYRAPGGAAAVPAQAGASLRAAFAPSPARAQQVAPVVAQDVAPPHPVGPAAVATLRQPAVGILRVSTRAALTPAGDTAAAATGAAPAQAQAAPPVPEGQQDPEAIRQAALAFLRQQTAGLPGKAIVTVAPAFPRGLAACTGLEPFLPTGARLWGRTTVGVRCAGAKPWTLYLQSKISVQGTYYVAARALSPGEVLTAADLVAHDGDLTQLPLAIITDPGQAVGGTSLVRVAAGLPLRQDMLRSASSVTIGQTVRVVAAGKGFTISSEGSVMNNAGPGQQVRVRLAAGQIVTAVVKDSGTVEIPL